MVKPIVKTIVINGKMHKNKRKRFYSSNKEGLIWEIELSPIPQAYSLK
jgi:hypothetical protein